MEEVNLIATNKVKVITKVGAIRDTIKLHHFDQICCSKEGNRDTP